MEHHKLNKNLKNKLIDQYLNYLIDDERTNSTSKKDIFLFRGESQDYGDTANVASILRTHKRQKDESILYNSYQKRFINKMNNINHSFDKLEFMQHYGLHTRLLDVTSNMLTALYFACCNNEMYMHLKNIPQMILI